MRVITAAILPRGIAMAVWGVVACALPASAAGQEPRLVVLGGITSSTLSGTTFSAPSRLTGAAGGLSGGVDIVPEVGLEIGLMVVQKGLSFQAAKAPEHVRINYLEAPMLVRLGTKEQSGVSLHFIAGPVVSVKLASSASYSGFRDSDVSTFDLGLQIGGAARLDAVELSLRYTLGIKTIDATLLPENVNNRSVALLMGVKVF